MRISKLNYQDSNKIFYANLNKKDNSDNSAFKINSVPSPNNKISFGSDIYSAAGSLAIKALKACTTLWGSKNAIKYAHELLSSSTPKKGIEMAIDVHSKIRGKFSELFFDLDGLTSRAASIAEDLPDKDFESRQLKQHLLRALYLTPTDSGPSSKAEELLISLDNKYHREFKKYLLTKYVLENRNGADIRDVDSILEGVGNESFRKKIRSAVKAQNVHQYSIEDDPDNYYRTHHPGIG